MPAKLLHMAPNCCMMMMMRTPFLLQIRLIDIFDSWMVELRGLTGHLGPLETWRKPCGVRVERSLIPCSRRLAVVGGWMGLWVGLKIDGTWEKIMIPSGDQTWQWKSASIRKMVLMGKSSINMGFSIAMFDYGGYWKWAGLVKDDKTSQNPQLPVEFLLVAMVNDEKWYAKLAWNILAKRASDWTRPYCTWLCIWGIVSG